MRNLERGQHFALSICAQCVQALSEIRDGKSHARVPLTRLSLPGWYDSHVYLFLPGQPYPRNEARPQIDHPSIDSRHVSVRIEHGNSIGE